MLPAMGSSVSGIRGCECMLEGGSVWEIPRGDGNDDVLQDGTVSVAFQMASVLRSHRAWTPLWIKGCATLRLHS